MNTVSNFSNIQTPKINFKAKKVAATRNVLNGVINNIDIYRLEKSDNKFLDRLKNSIDFQKLWPQWTEEQAKRVQSIFEYCTTRAKNSVEDGFTSFVAITNNNVCGLMTTISEKNKIFLDGLCFVPTGVGEKAPFVGKTMFSQFFNMAKDRKVKKAGINDAVNDSPCNVIDKYKKLGFKEKEIGEKYTDMECDKYNIGVQIDELGNVIEYKKENDPFHYDLSEYV